MSWLDYPPGPVGWLGAAADGMTGGGEDTAGELRDNDIGDYSFACGACDAPIADTDSICGACGEPIEWNEPPIN